jgi:uncharacterized membrane protein YhaH (DUF805 family)
LPGGAAHREVAFEEALRLFFRNYANFHGRSSRGAYWWWFLAGFLIACAFAAIDYAMGARPGEIGLLGTLYSLAVLIPNVAVGVRRLHDTDRSGWWLLVALIPIAGLIWLIIYLVEEGERRDNEYGPDVEAGR